MAPAGFDARFSALWRRYVYRICDQPQRPRPAAARARAGLAPAGQRDADGQAAAGLLGEHDFAAYCRPREGASTVRTLLRLEPLRTDGLVEVTVVADAFCHSMVRALVGALVAVGEGRLPVDEPARILAGGGRDPRVQVLPAHGLTLEEVGYPPTSSWRPGPSRRAARRGEPVP